ncbi:hypothetical protein [Bradyrhizobium genosp. P]|uniref:hypothetical protein n=1 Tax=Bradyrhizobium genosp. P TaxID=83641 RepID=UPI003CF3C13D
MNITSPILASVAHAAAFLDDSQTSLLQAIAPGPGWFDDNPDGGLGVAMSGLAGVAAALAVAILLSIYFRTGYRSTSDMLRHGLAAALVLGLIAFVVYDMGHSALAYLGLNAATTAVEFGTCLSKTEMKAGMIAI